MKLSASQLALLENAHIQLRSDEQDASRGLCSHPGWFMPTFTTKGSIEFSSRPQTAKALHTRGLLECQEIGVSYWNHRARRWQVDVEYRISEAGIKYLKEGAS